jgi:hypothetical protein
MMNVDWKRVTQDTELMLDELQHHLSSQQLETIQNFLEFGECYLALDSLCEFLVDNRVPVPRSHRQQIIRLFHDSGVPNTDLHEQMLMKLDPPQQTDLP